MVLVPLVLILLAIFLWSWALRRQVALRTKELNENKEKYRSFFENSMDAILLTAPDGSIFAANPSACELFGFTEDEIIKLGREGLVDATDPRLPALLAERERNRKARGELTYIRKNGSRFSAEVTSAFFQDSAGKIRTSMIIRDMTERERAEEVLRERDDRFKKLSQHVPGMIYQFMRRPDGTYCLPFTTDAIKDIFGCSPQDVLEEFSPIVEVIVSEDLNRVIDSIEWSAKRMTIWQCEYRVQIPGGQIRWLHGESSPEKLADGSILWHGFNTDITERKRAEAEQERLRAQ